MDGWMDEWMGGYRICELNDKWFEWWMDECIDGWVNGWMNELVGRRVDSFEWRIKRQFLSRFKKPYLHHLTNKETIYDDSMPLLCFDENICYKNILKRHKMYQSWYRYCVFFPYTNTNWTLYSMPHNPSHHIWLIVYSFN